MANKRSGYGKTSWYAVLAGHLRLEIGGVHELYNFGVEYYEKELKGLHSRYERLAEEAFVDERDRLDSIRHELGYAMVFLLCSVTEDGLLHLLRQLKRNDAGLEQEFEHSYSEDRLPDKSFLERYALFHRDKFGTDFWSDVVPARSTSANRAWLPDGLALDLPSIDVSLLVDFVWARNKIAHQRGTVRAAQIKRPDGNNRDVPLSPDRSQIEVQQHYLERVTPHLIAFFDKVLEDLRAHYE